MDIHGAAVLIELFPIAARTVTTNGAGFDATQHLGLGKAILDAGAGGGTTPTLDVKLQDSADNASFADIAGAAFAQVTTVASLQSIAVNLDSARAFIRAVATIGGTTPTFTFGVIIVARKQVMP